MQGCGGRSITENLRYLGVGALLVKYMLYWSSYGSTIRTENNSVSNIITNKQTKKLKKECVLHAWLTSSCQSLNIIFRVVPKELLTFLGSLYKEVANRILAAIGDRIFCCERQKTQGKYSLPSKQHFVLDSESTVSRELSKSWNLYFKSCLIEVSCYKDFNRRCMPVCGGLRAGRWQYWSKVCRSQRHSWRKYRTLLCLL